MTPPIGIQSLLCTACGTEHGLHHLYKCSRCGGTLDAVYEAPPAAVRDLMATAASGGRRSMWDFGPLLPVSAVTRPVSLGEGWTPLVEARRAAAWAGAADVHLKVEGANPTGSFKDRPVSSAVTKAVELGVTSLVTASSGNAGAAVAAYAARVGIPATVLVPDGLPAAKLAPVALHGAHLVAVDGDFSRAYDLAQAWAGETGAFNVTSTLLSAFTTEGNKTVAYELWIQLGRVPDWILIPVSSGPLLVGIFKGFCELRDAGIVPAVPRMVAVQASGCAPIAHAFEAGAEEVAPWGEAHTVASGIRDPLHGYEEDGTLTLRRLRESGGLAMAVDDEEILAAAGVMARAEGQAAEPTGAVAVAGLRRLAAEGTIGRGDAVVCLVTGHLLKDPATLVEGLDLPRPRAIPADLAALRAALAHPRTSRP